MVTIESEVSTEVQSLIGLNTNLTLGGQMLHVQTEDLGRQRACSVTHVFSKDGQVIQKVRFDHSQHLGHPNLLGILARAMRAQHATVTQRLRKEGAEPAANILQTDSPCVSGPSQTPSPEAPKPASKQRPRLDPGTWDRLVAKAKDERERERAAMPVAPLPEANTGAIGLQPLWQAEKHDARKRRAPMSRASRASSSVSWIAPTIAGLLCTQLACSFESFDHLGNGVKRDAEVVVEAGGGGLDMDGPGPDQATIDLSSLDGPVLVASEVGGQGDRVPATDGTGPITDGADGAAGRLTRAIDGTSGAVDTGQDTAMVEPGDAGTETEVVDGSIDVAGDDGSGGSPEVDRGAGDGGGTDAGVPARDAATLDCGDALSDVADSSGPCFPGTLDSGDAPSNVADSSGPGFPYVPTNFDPSGLDPAHAGSAVLLNCGVSTFDSSTSSFDNWCGQTPAVVKRTQAGGPDTVILALPDFTVAAGATLRLIGAYPVVLAVFDNATIAGTIDASANGTTPGPGGNLTCGTSRGADGNGSPARFSGASGGGGGGFGTAGGSSGMADTDNSDGKNPAAAGGQVRGGATLAPLMGGCAGGRAGGCSTNGGAGGGAIQISAARTLTVTGAIRANGADGSLPCGPSDEGGGTGGGSGGGILLEATTVARSGATLAANGGSGGTEGAFFHCGGTEGGAGSTDPSKPGADGMSCAAGSPGGGGGYGRISVANR